MRACHVLLSLTAGLLLTTVTGLSQINFTKSVHYAAPGDSVAAGEGAMPVTSGYTYRIPHPEPAVFPLLDAALQGFDQALRFALQTVPVPPGSRVAVVDLYSASVGRRGLLTIERRLGYNGPFDFDIHPTNLGHSFIAEEFSKTWSNLP